MDKRNVQSFLMVSAAFFALSAAVRPNPAQACANTVRPLSTAGLGFVRRVDNRGNKS